MEINILKSDFFKLFILSLYGKEKADEIDFTPLTSDFAKEEEIEEISEETAKRLLGDLREDLDLPREYNVEDIEVKFEDA